MLTLPHSTRGGWKGAVLTICNHLQTLNHFRVPEGSGAAHRISAQRHKVVWEWLFLPTPKYPGWIAEVSRGKKNIQGNKQRKREESRGWSQSNQLPHPKQRRNPRLVTKRNHGMAT